MAQTTTDSYVKSISVRRFTGEMDDATAAIDDRVGDPLCIEAGPGSVADAFDLAEYHNGEDQRVPQRPVRRAAQAVRQRPEYHPPLGGDKIPLTATGTAFGRTPHWILKHPDLSDRAIRTYGCIQIRADFEDIRKGIRITIASLASSIPSRESKSGHRSTRQVATYITELEDAGAIKVLHVRQPGGGWDVNVFVLQPQPAIDADPDDLPQHGDEASCSPVHAPSDAAGTQLHAMNASDWTHRVQSDAHCSEAFRDSTDNSSAVVRNCVPEGDGEAQQIVDTVIAQKIARGERLLTRAQQSTLLSTLKSLLAAGTHAKDLPAAVMVAHYYTEAAINRSLVEMERARGREALAPHFSSALDATIRHLEDISRAHDDGLVAAWVHPAVKEFAGLGMVKNGVRLGEAINGNTFTYKQLQDAYNEVASRWADHVAEVGGGGGRI